MTGADGEAPRVEYLPPTPPRRRATARGATGVGRGLLRDARVIRFRVLAPGATRARIGPRRALVGLVGTVLAATPPRAGYFMVLVDDRRRGLHDRLARDRRHRRIGHRNAREP